MKATTIKPKYSFKSLWDVILLSLGLIVVIILAAVRVGFGLETLSLLIMLVGFCFWWTHYLIRHFIFTPSSFTVVRYIMPPKTIKYAEITDVGNSNIKTKIGNVNLAGMTNDDEIINKFNDLINQGKINQNQLEKKVRAEETIWRKSMLPSLIISLPFWLILFRYWPFHKMWFSPLGFGLVCGLILFFVVSIVQWVVKKKLTNDKAG